MAEYLPFQGKHSIQEAQISLLFPESFDRRSIEVAESFAQAELSEALPRWDKASGDLDWIETTDPTSPALLETVRSDLVGFRFFKVQGDGQPARILRMVDDTLSVSFMDYESWGATKADALQYLRSVLNYLPLDQNPVAAFSLRFVDRYTYSGNPMDAKADLLFVGDNPHITPHTFDAGPTWHCNTGWFEDPAEEEDLVLHNLNAASGLVDLSSAVTIDHHATRHLGAPRDTLMALLVSSGGTIGLVDALDSLHDRNKSILGQALRPEILARIGMTK